MKKIVLNRQPIGVEDLAIGLGTQTQTRGGVEVTVTEINAGSLPFDETRTLVEFAQEVNLEAIGDSIEAINNINNDLTKILNVEDNLPEVISVAQNIVPNLTEILNVDTLASQVTQDKASVSSMKLAVETLYDTFDDRFLGTKTVDPTLDNDGNALIDGAMYFNKSSNIMKVYDIETTTWYSIPQIYLSALLDVNLTSITSGNVLRWNGTKWINYTLSKADVGLNLVDNTSDATKNVLSATKLTTARTINGIAFDGSANITIVESGSNANGAYTKFANGSMMEYKSINCAATANERYTEYITWPVTGQSSGTGCCLVGVTNSYNYTVSQPPAFNGANFYFVTDNTQTYHFVLTKYTP